MTPKPPGRIESCVSRFFAALPSHGLFGLTGRQAAIFGTAMFYLFLAVDRYILEPEPSAQAARHIDADRHLAAKFTGPAFPADMTIADRAARAGFVLRSQLVGWLDAIIGVPTGRAIFSGWAVDLSYVDKSPVVLIFLNREFVGQTVPDAARPDVIRELKLNERKSSERIGFTVNLPARICDPGSSVEALIISRYRYRYAPIGNLPITPNCTGIPSSEQTK